MSGQKEHVEAETKCVFNILLYVNFSVYHGNSHYLRCFLLTSKQLTGKLPNTAHHFMQNAFHSNCIVDQHISFMDT